tara:strand:+ start:271 stop:996 length:726 start_codon:yes stop_codon:yes gene_type:complete
MIEKTVYSPNFSKKIRKNKDIKFIILHYTGMQSKIVSIKRLLNPKYKVSCHYLIDREGRIIKMVDENKIAWHAGKSKWKNFSNLNKNSIGIELVNKGHEFGYERFTKVQIKKLVIICKYLKKKYKIKNSNIIGHSDIAPLRKKDPGENFPWLDLHKKNIGIWYKNLNSRKINLNEDNSLKLFYRNLYKIGYRYFSLNKKSKTRNKVVKAFQRRFNPNYISGNIDQATYKICENLAKYSKKT